MTSDSEQPNTERRRSDVKDCSGLRFGRLLVVGPAPKRPGVHQAYWTAVCDCGSTIEVRGSRLRAGMKSCGCRRGPRQQKRPVAPRKKESPTYVSWLSMRRRCLLKTHRMYSYYGGAGVTICERWSDFANFLADMGERPEGKTLDRYPNGAGNYEPGNCRWATKTEQAQNRKSTVFVEINGERKCLAEWARFYQLSVDTLWSRRQKGWDLITALTTPGKRQSKEQA